MHTKMTFKRNQTLRRIDSHSGEGGKEDSRAEGCGWREALRVLRDNARGRTPEAEWPGRDLENARSGVPTALPERL